MPLLARLMWDIAPNSLVILRLPSAAASFLLILLTGLTACELRAGRAAQALAAVCMAVSPLAIGSGHLLSTTTFDLPAWALAIWLIVRILRTGADRLWLAVGVATGVGLFASDLIAFLLVSVVISLAITGPRRAFRSVWLYAGGAIAVGMWIPYLIWQATHGWPELAVAHSIATGGSGTSAPRWAILFYQVVLFEYLTPVWVAGLVRLLRGDDLRWCRALGVSFFVAVVIFVITGGNPYYLGGFFPLLMSAGAQATVAWFGRGRRRLRIGLVTAAAVLNLTALPVVLPIVPAADLHDTPVVKLNYDAGETVGWPVFVREIAAVYHALPASQRASAIVLGSNYGEAGAVDHFGPTDGLPAAYSGHNGFYYWGPPPASAATAVAVGFSRSQLTPYCGSLRLAAHLNNHLGVSDDEQDAPVWVCSALRAPWTSIWPHPRDFG